MTAGEETRAPRARWCGWLGTAFSNAYLLLALAGLCWSVNHILGRAIAGQVPPFALSVLRYLLAALILLPFARGHLARDWPLIRRHAGLLVYLAVIGGGLFSALQFLGLQLTTAMNVSVMNSLGPVLIAAVSAALFGDRLNFRQMLGIVVSLCGVLAIISKLDLHVLTTLGFNLGDVVILFNMLLWAIYSASLRLRPAIHPMSFLFVFSVVSGITTLPLWIWEQASGFTLQPTWLTVFAIAYVTVFSTIIAFAFWNRGIELIGANRAGIFLHLVPVYSACLTGAVLGEPLMGFHVVGFVLILSGVWLTARRA